MSYKQAGMVLDVEEKGPHSKPDKLRGGLPGSLTNPETDSSTQDGLKLKLAN